MIATNATAQSLVAGDDGNLLADAFVSRILIEYQGFSLKFCAMSTSPASPVAEVIRKCRIGLPRHRSLTKSRRRESFHRTRLIRPRLVRPYPSGRGCNNSLYDSVNQMRLNLSGE